MSKPLTIAVSDVASLIGEHKWVPAEGTIEKYRNRFNCVQHTSKNAKLKLKMEKAGIDARSILKKVNIKTKSSDVVQHLVEAVREHKQRESESEPESEIDEADIPSLVHTTHGTNSESDIISMAEEKYNITITHDEPNFHHQRKTYKLCGRVDGLSTDENGITSVIEIKSRMNRLFDYLPAYEKIQVQLYMHSLGHETAYLIQHHEGEIDRFVLNYDEAFVKDILHRLKKVVVKSIKI